MKYLNEMNSEEFCQVWERCDYLRYKALGWYEDQASEYVQDILHGIPSGVDYQIQGGGYGYSYINFTDCNHYDLLRYLETIENDHGIFDAEKMKILRRYFPVVDRASWDYKVNPKAKDLEYMENKIDEILKEFASALTDYLVAEYDIDDDDLMSEAYCLEWFDRYYVDDDGDVYEERSDLKLT